MQFDAQGMLLPYAKWHWETNDPAPAQDVFLTGCGAALYFPGSLDDEVTNTEAFMELCPLADDVWFNLMACRKGTRRGVLPDGSGLNDLVVISGSQKQSLWAVNATENDRQIQAVLRRYPDVQEKLKGRRTS